ncbi:MAG: Uma2 family endonuclease [Eubacterium sp.]|nr:Uma2 family endonuclease [Eubacterium sp.]
MTLSELKQLKNETGLSYEEIAERSGVPLSTVQKVFSGVTKSPRSDTLFKLSRAFSPIKDTSVALEPAFEPGSRAPFQRQGTYTIEDYNRIPDNRRVELIDGVIYDMTAPTTVHQHLVMFVSTTIYNFIQSNHGDCIPFAAPTDVRLDILKDDRTMVQPDIFIVCDEKKIDGKNVKGAPDFVAEVLSPSTRKKDMTKKLEKYADAGVREYWIIDPENGQITVYNLENNCELFVYSFGQKVPVNIYNGKLKIDFGNMPKYITKWYNENWQLIIE